MITFEDIKKNPEVQALIEGSQRQLQELRIYRTFFSPYFHCIKSSCSYFRRIRI
ncbi:MAG: hypothetical protein ACLU8F_05910 [Clostridia bacterium]